ncbi:hypothetical protein PYJP_14340 [Pyrofollis japonicus]|nr:hypothetical protein PYJP_14340 [Pyrofollis japonicus]
MSYNNVDNTNTLIIHTISSTKLTRCNNIIIIDLNETKIHYNLSTVFINSQITKITILKQIDNITNVKHQSTLVINVDSLSNLLYEKEYLGKIIGLGKEVLNDSCPIAFYSYSGFAPSNITPYIKMLLDNDSIVLKNVLEAINAKSYEKTIRGNGTKTYIFQDKIYVLIIRVTGKHNSVPIIYVADADPRAKISIHNIQSHLIIGLQEVLNEQ